MKNLYFLMLFLLVSCGIKLGRNDREKRILPSASMQNFLYTYTEKSGFREWEVKAAQATVYEDINKVYLYNLTMTFFSESNQIKSVLVANKGEVDQSIGNMVAEGEVQIFSSNQSQLLTEKIYWDQQNNLFYSETNKLVTYIRPSYKIIGYDMISDSQLENVEIDNAVGRIDTKKQEENTEELDTEKTIPVISDTIPEGNDTEPIKNRV
ncbi:MAG: LPS export ABC transporter periplasmic protein LptC [Brevinema sp.]